MCDTEIKVTIDDGKVSFEPSDFLGLDVGDKVEWVFAGLPARSRPCLLFTELPEDGRERMPFRALENQGDRITGWFGGVRGTYRYQFGFVPEGGNGSAVIQLPYERDYRAGGISGRGGPGGGDG